MIDTFYYFIFETYQSLHCHKKGQNHHPLVQHHLTIFMNLPTQDGVHFLISPWTTWINFYTYHPSSLLVSWLSGGLNIRRLGERSEPAALPEHLPPDKEESQRMSHRCNLLCEYNTLGNILSIHKVSVFSIHMLEDEKNGEDVDEIRLWWSWHW